MHLRQTRSCLRYKGRPYPIIDKTILKYPLYKTYRIRDLVLVVPVLVLLYTFVVDTHALQAPLLSCVVTYVEQVQVREVLEPVPMFPPPLS